MVAGVLGDHQEITIEQGYLFAGSFTVYSDEAMTNPIDLTGYTATFKVRSPSSENPVVLNGASYCSIPTPSDGTVVWSVPASITAAIDAFDRGTIEFSLTPPSGAEYITKVAQGPCRCTRFVNRT